MHEERAMGAAGWPTKVGEGKRCSGGRDCVSGRDER